MKVEAEGIQAQLDAKAEGFRNLFASGGDDSDFASQLRFLQRSYLDDSREITPEEWNRQGWSQRLWQNAIGIFSPLL